ncbi:MAG: hypothetical protein WC130_05100 [Kiritimatiellia bacterium]
MITEDLEALFADCGVKTTCGSASGLGLFDESDEDVGGIAISSDRSVTVITEKFQAAATRGAEIEVDGVAYKVRAFRKIADGKLARITLELND